MGRIDRLFINLFPEPPRNKNQFKLLLILCSFLILLFLYFDSVKIYRAGFSFFMNSKSIENLRREIEKISKENRDLETKIIELKKNYKKKIDLINSIIEEKNLSWLSLLSIFETSLSERTALISLNPSSKQDVLRAEIMSDDIEDVLKTINRLSKNDKVSNVTIERESEKEGNKIVLVSIKLKGYHE